MSIEHTSQEDRHPEAGDGEGGHPEHTISRDEYDALRSHRYAGPASELLPQTRQRWSAPYWSLLHTEHGVALVGTRIADEARDGARNPYDRAEFDPAAADEPETLLPGTRQPVPDTRPEVEAVGVKTDGRVVAYGLTPRAWSRARALSILTGIPHRHHGDVTQGPARAFSGLGVLRLDCDLDMWFDLDGAEHHGFNAAASAIAEAFGVAGGMWGPVMFTGVPDAHGVTASITVAASVLIAGMAAAHDHPESGTDEPLGERRARDFLALGVETRDPGPDPDPDPDSDSDLDPDPSPPGGDAPAEDNDEDAIVLTFDALAHTLTADGDIPCCAECGAPGSHAEHQPEALRRSTFQIVR